jgi:soluble lytic murein transglycosylase-like protein
MRIFLSSRLRFLAAALAVLSLPCFAAEIAVLRNGFTVRHERREVIGAVTRMYVSADGSSYVDVPTAEIEHFEVAEEPAAEAGLRASGSGLPASGDSGVVDAASAPRAADLNAVIAEASGRYRLDPDLVNSVIKAESGFNVRALSPKGAQGLMQLMPGTASQLGVPNAFDPEANVDGGARYLRELLERYNFDLVKALAAYNAGTRRVEQYGGVPPYHETRAYVRRIVLDFNKKKLAQKQAVAQKSSAKANVATSAKKSSASRADAKTNLARAAE